MTERAAIAVCILAMMSPVLAGQPGFRSRYESPPLNLAQQPHSGITINGNYDFANQSASEGWPGNGTASNPYVIDNYTVAGSFYALSISQVSVSFVIRRCTLTTTFPPGPCVSLSNVSFGTIEHCVIESLDVGVGFHLAKNCSLDSSWIGGGWKSVSLTESYNCTFTNNILANGGVLLDSVDDAAFHHTFSNNTVMGRALGYFWNISNAYIDGRSFGQVIAVNCRFLALVGGSMSGVPCGVQLVACQDCALRSCNASDSEYGVVVLTCDAVTVEGSEFFGNTYCGVVINRSSNCILTSNSVHSNPNDGIMILGPNATVTDNSIYQNGGGIVLLEGWGGIQTSDGLVTGNSIRDNSGYGILLGTGVSGCWLFNNVFDSNGINARDEGSGNSWDNGVDTGNQWSDYSGYGVYQILGSAGSVDHYARVTYSNTTNEIIDGLVGPDLALAIWLSLSIAVIATPVFLVIRKRLSQSAETGLWKPDFLYSGSRP